MPFKLPTLLDFQSSTHLFGVGSFSYSLLIRRRNQFPQHDKQPSNTSKASLNKTERHPHPKSNQHILPLTLQLLTKSKNLQR